MSNAAEQGAGARGGLFVGRDRELRDLRAGLADTTAGRSRVFLVSGEPGIGKSRLSDELAGEAEQAGCLVLWGRCWEAGGAPAYWPWVQILRTLLRRGPAGAGERADVLSQILPDVSPPTAGPERTPEEARFALFDAVASMLGDAADAQPLVLILDDLHAADPPSLLLFRFVARARRDARLLMLGTYRDVEARGESHVREAIADLARDAVMLPLRGLARDEVARYIEGAGGSGRVADQVYRATEGNPFFVDEVVRLLGAQGELAHERAAATLAIPESVRETIRRRLERLSPEALDLLSVASVVGREFDVDLLAAATGRARGETFDLLASSVSSGMVEELMRAIGRFRFSHALVRDTLYEGLPGSRRAELHRVVAKAIERVHAGFLDGHVAELAHHFAAAGGSSREALSYAMRAGERAVASLAYEEGVEHFRRALGMLEHGSPDPVRRAGAILSNSDDRTRGGLLMSLGDARWRAGDLAGSRESFWEGAEQGRRNRDPELMARAALGIAQADVGGVFVPAYTPNLPLIALIEEAIGALGERAPALRARLLAFLAGYLYFTDDSSRCDELSARAVAIASELDDADTLAHCLSARHVATWSPDNLEERLAIAQRIVALAERVGSKEMQLQGRLWLQRDLMEAGDMEGARREIDAYIATAAALKRPQYRGYAAMLEGMLALSDGRLDDARVAIDEQNRIGEMMHEEQLLLTAQVQGQHLNFELDRTEEALAITRTYIVGLNAPTTHALASWSLAEAGRMAEARAQFDLMFDAEGLRFPRSVFWLSGLGQVSEAARCLDAAEHAEEILELLRPYERRVSVAGRGGVAVYAPVTRYLGVLAALAKRYEEAERYFAAAIEGSARMGLNLGRMHSRRDLARMLLARDAPGDAERARAMAAEGLEEAETRGLVALARAFREIAAGTAPAAPSGGPELTREGELWTIRYGDEVARLRDSRGLGYLAELIASPRVEFHALELAASAGAGARGAAAVAADAGLRTARLDEGADDVLDPQAKAEFRRRIGALQADAEEARAFGDAERAERAEEEIEAIARELSAAAGLGGRSRKMTTQGERARVAVTKAIKTALDRIADAAPELGRHLAAAVRTGTFCSYSPDRDRAEG